MLESLVSGFADISLPELALIAGMALVASVVGGVAGYGTGALMPLVLVPIVGAEPVVPILSLSALFTNSSRVAAFWPLIDRRRALIVLVAAVPTCALGAWGYTMLTGKGAAILIGGMLMASVPLRRLMRRRGLALSTRGLAVASFGWGPLAGGTVGAGIILLAPDGGWARGRRRRRNRCRRLHWHRADQVCDVWARGRHRHEGDRDCAAHRLRGISRRFRRSRIDGWAAWIERRYRAEDARIEQMQCCHQPVLRLLFAGLTSSSAACSRLASSRADLSSSSSS